MTGQRGQLGMALALEVVPLPIPKRPLARVQRLLGQVELIPGNLRLGIADRGEVGLTHRLVPQVRRNAGLGPGFVPLQTDLHERVDAERQQHDRER